MVQVAYGPECWILNSLPTADGLVMGGVSVREVGVGRGHGEEGGSDGAGGV